MNLSRIRPGLAVLGILVLAACGGTGSATTAPAIATVSATRDVSAPVGVIAIGHSGLTGEGTGTSYEAVLANSWATGTNPEVDSIYLRMVAARPETAGHFANTAQGGAVALQLLDQAQRSLAAVPVPQLAIVSTIDNDIRCDGTDAAHVPDFGMQVKAALDLIHTASPNTHILVVGQLGRPSVDYIEQLVATSPSEKRALTGPGICDFFTPDGQIAPAHFATLTGIIDAYEAEEARVCAAMPSCVTDGGVRAAWIDKSDLFSGDAGHLNLRGQTAEAAQIWPVVAQLLGL